MPTDPRTAGFLPPDPQDRSYVSPAALQQVYAQLQDIKRTVSSLDGARTSIRPQSITAGSSGMLQVSSVTAANIIAGNVVASIMTANAVNAGHLDANSVRTSILNATSIIAQGLQTEVLNAVKGAISDLSGVSLNTGTVTAQLIRTDISPNARVEIGSTAGGIKGYNSSNVLTFGFDVTTGAATVGAITVTGANGTQVPASTLTGFVGGGNVLKDSSFESTDPATPGSLWTTFAGGSGAKSSTRAFHGTKSLQVTRGGGAGARSQVFTDLVANHGVPVAAVRSRPLVFSAWVWVDTTATTLAGTDQSLDVGDGGVSANVITPISTLTKGQWNRVVLKFTPAASAAGVFLGLSNPYSNGPVYYDGVQVELGDAATAYNPKADEILYGQINTTELAAGAVSTSILAAGAITADKISLGMATVAVRNGQFSEGNPADGTSLTTGWPTATGTVTVQTDATWNGRIARMTSPTGSGSWRGQDVQMPVGRNVIRAWIKTASLTGTGAAITLGAGTATATLTNSVNITGTKDWTLVEAVANVTVAGTVGVFIFGAVGTGTANFANVHVVPAITGTTLTPTAIDAMTVTGATLRTAASGARIELDSTNGLRAIDSGGGTVFQADLLGGVSLTGSVYAKTGLRIDAASSLSPPNSNMLRFISAGSGNQTGKLHNTEVAGGVYSVLSANDTGTQAVGTAQLTARSGDGTKTPGLNVYASNTDALLGLFSVTPGPDITIMNYAGQSAFVQVPRANPPNFVQYAYKISERGSAAVNVTAGATQTITITGNQPGNSPSGTVNTFFPMVAFAGTNTQRLTWAWSGLGLSIDVFNPTGATITGTVYWVWIAHS